MKDYLQHYTMKLTALAPIHIGSGRMIGKKEYIQHGISAPVMIPDQSRMFHGICLLHKEKAFEDFMLNSSNRGSLDEWLTQQRIDKTRIQKWISYSLDAGDAFIRTNGAESTPKGIRCFYKDAYGMPYIPGSSLKGLIRTALLVSEVKRRPEEYGRSLQELEDAAPRGEQKRSYLASQTKRIETRAFHTLERPKTKTADAVNSVMSGLIVGDSREIRVSQLTLCQKIDYSLGHKEKPLPILREALKPGTEVLFDLTIDTQVLPYSIEDIMEALDAFQKDCYEYFYRRFGRGRDAEGIVWLGGGAGFLSKTILYSLYGDRAVKITNQVYRSTMSPQIYRNHHHEDDIGLGIAPHVCKCTRYQGKLYDMGMGRLEVVQEPMR